MDPTEQRRAALRKANLVRKQRKELREEMRHGNRLPREILEDIPEWMRTCPIGEFIIWTPGIGKSRMRQMLKPMQVSPTLRLEQLSETTLERVLRKIEEFYSPARVRQSRDAA